MRRAKMLLAPLVLLVVGCDYELLVTQPDAVQGVIRDQYDLILGAVTNWAMFANEMLAGLPL